MIFLTSSWYSAGCWSNSAGVATTNGAAGRRKRVEIGFERGEMRGELAIDERGEVVERRIGRGRGARKRARLREHERFTPAYAEYLSRDVLRAGRAEVRREAADRCGRDGERGGFIDRLRRRCGHDRFGHAGSRKWGDHVRGDAAARHIERGNAHQAEETGLRAGVGALTVVPVERGRRADRNDAAPAVRLAAACLLRVFAQHRRRRAQQVERRRQVGRNHGFEVGAIAFEEKRVAQDRRVVDDDVEAAETFAR